MKSVVLCIISFAVLLTLAAPAVAQKYEGVPAKSGQAVFKSGGKDLAFKFVEGGFQKIQGFTLATLVFKPDQRLNAAIHLNLTLMYQAPGKVDLDSAFSMSGISVFADGDVSRFTKGKSKCTITLTKANATEVEGVADCPLLHDISGKAMPPLNNLKFSATTK